MIWFEEDVQELENKIVALTYSPSTLFYGSSTIRLWQTLTKDFKEYQPVNLGFGGSTLAACVWFFDRILAPFTPDYLVVYAGDNDLGDGRHPEEVFLFFQQLVIRMQNRFPGNLPCFFVSLKPSPSRLHLLESFKYANQLIQTEIQKHLPNWTFINTFDQMLNRYGHPKNIYYAEDGLHLNAKGYELWTKIIKASLPPITQIE
ncbi:MAG: GDSL-type esterase/lipase family protein [Bacteroidota bacterium]|nr:GDSL-type esterase/lipase family protein [Bacteroidota bacterium]